MKLSTNLNNFVLKFLEGLTVEGLDNDKLLELWGEKNKEFTKLIDASEKKEKNKKKDENAPKGARTSYIFFCMEERPKIKKENPDIDSKDVIRELAKRWNKVKDDEELLKHYSSMADADRKRASEEKKEYVPKEKKEEKEGKDKKKVKRSKTGYQLFCDDERSKVKDDGFTGKDIMTELGRRWTDVKSNDEDTYQEYMERAAELKESIAKETITKESITNESDEEVEDVEAPKPKKVKKVKKVNKIIEDDE